MAEPPFRLSPQALAPPVILLDGSGVARVSITAAGLVTVQAAGGSLGFYGATPAAKPTGVAVDAAGIHAALVTLGLIAA